MNMQTCHGGDRGVAEEKMDPFIALLVRNYGIALSGDEMGPRPQKRRSGPANRGAKLRQLPDRFAHAGVHAGNQFDLTRM